MATRTQQAQKRAIARDEAVQMARPITISRILVPVDLRHPKDSANAVATAAWLSKTNDAPCDVLTVVSPLEGGLTSLHDERRQVFETFVAKHAETQGIALNPVFSVHESVVAMIKKVVETRGVDLVVMPTHKPRLLDHIFSSRAAQTALHAHCSVLVVR